MSNPRRSGPRLLVWQWGRLGAGPRFAAELASAFEGAGIDTVLSLSTRAESFATLSGLTARGFHVDAGDSLPGQALFGLALPLQLSRLAAFIRREAITGAVCAMPGYWDRWVAACLKRLGVPLVTIAHDVRPHMGDRHALAYRLQRGVLRESAAIVTLSEHVADQLRAGEVAAGTLPPIRTFAHPPFAFDDLALPAPVPFEPHDGPLRVLVAGRIKAYKGVETALAMLDELAGHPATLRIAGAFDRPSWRDRAEADTRVSLRPEWLSERDLVAEIDASDVVIFPYVEATQSGLVPLCQSRGRVAVVSPVGGLAEQVSSGRDGLVAEAATAQAFAQAIRRLIDDAGLRQRLASQASADHDPSAGWAALASNIVDVFGEH